MILMTETTIQAEGFFHVFVPAVADLIWGTFAFVLIAVAVYKFAWPSFMAMLDERGEKIERGLQAAEIARAEVAAERADLQEQVRGAHREANEIRENANANAKAIVGDAQTKARAEAEQILDGAQRRIAADTDAAKRVLRSDVGALATELASRIVGESLTDSELAKRVTDRFLDELESNLTPANQEV